MSDHQDGRSRGAKTQRELTIRRKRGRPSRTENRENTRRSRSRSRQVEPRNRSHSNSRSSHHSQSSQRSQISNHEQAPKIPPPNANTQQYIDCCRGLLIYFFANIDQGKGLVFSPQDRIKLIKEQQRNKSHNGQNETSANVINWNKHPCWNEEEQKNKVQTIFQKNKIQLSAQKVQDLKEIFYSISFMFCNEVTVQLYTFLMETLKIALEGASEHEMESISNLSQRVRNTQEYKFFGFKFSKYFKIQIAENKSKKMYQELTAMLVTIFRRRIL